MVDVDSRRTLERVNRLEREIEEVKRDLLKSLSEEPRERDRLSLYGSVSGGDITEDMIENAKKSLFHVREDRPNA